MQDGQPVCGHTHVSGSQRSLPDDPLHARPGDDPRRQPIPDDVVADAEGHMPVRLRRVSGEHRPDEALGPELQGRFVAGIKFQLQSGIDGHGHGAFYQQVVINDDFLVDGLLHRFEQVVGGKPRRTAHDDVDGALPSWVLVGYGGFDAALHGQRGGLIRGGRHRRD